MVPRARLRRSTLVLLILLTGYGPAYRAAGTIEVASLDFEGVRAVDEDRLKAVLGTQVSSRLPWGRAHVFDRAVFEEDLKRIEAFYHDRGYPDARVASFDVSLNDRKDEVRLSVVVSEGEPILTEAVRLLGFEVIPEHLAELRDRIPVEPGTPRDRLAVQAARELAAGALRDHGYPDAKVEATEEPGSGPRRVVVTLQAVAGNIARFGAIEIAGNSSVDAEVIRRQVTFRPGELFQAGRLAETQQKLYGLELFQFANVEAVGRENGGLDVTTRVTVAEGKHRRITFGFGYGTEEKARADVQWRHVNFFGGARTAGIHGRWSSLSRGVRVNFNEPYLFRPNLSLGLSGERWFADEPAYKLDSFGSRAVVKHQRIRRNPLTRREAATTHAVSFINELEEFSIANAALEDLSFRDELIALGLDPRTGVGKGTLSALAYDFQRNTAANLLDASRGYVVSVHLENGGRWLPGGFDYLELSGEGRYYHTIGRRVVLAARARLGAIDGAGPEAENVPFFKRYFLGGSSSLRGWGRFEVSPLSGSGLPIGGHSVLETSAELRAPILGKLGGVLFVDAGNAWSSPWDINLGDLEYSVGPGLRYNTPVGPIRVDVGYQLTPLDGLLVNGRPERRRWRLHFSIGQAF
jgi:outer membrane protein insertion porin family/translocation and assembly module TamA